jgi:hypothetical protein
MESGSGVFRFKTVVIAPERREETLTKMAAQGWILQKEKLLAPDQLLLHFARPKT